MKLWKRYLSIGTAVILTAATMAGCGGTSKTGEQTTQTTTEVTGEETTADAGTSSSEQPYEVAVQLINISQQYADLAAVEAAINEITVPAINATVKINTVPISEQATKLSLSVAAGEKLDLVATGLITQPSGLVAQGLLADITPYITPALKDLAGDLLEAGTIGGKVYSYPAILYPGTSVSFVYDKDLAEQYKIQVPAEIKSNEDWTNLLKQVKDSGMSAYGISLGDGGGASITEFGANFDGLGDNNTLSYGVVVDPANNTTITNWYESEEFAQMCKDHYDWMQQGYCVPDSLTNGYTTTDSMSNGECFGYSVSTGVSSSETYWGGLTGKNLGIVPIRSAMITTGYVNTQSWGVASNSANPEKAVQLLDLIYSNSDLANLFNYGIEGTNYVKAEGSQNIIAFPEGKDPSTCGYGGDAITWFGDSSKVFQRTPNTDDFFATVADFGPEKATKSSCLGYTFDTTKVSTQLAAVQSIVNTYKPTLTTGNADPNEVIPQFIEELKAAGIDEVIKENQVQLDAWLAAR